VSTKAGQLHFEVAVRALFLKGGVFDAQNLVTIPDAKLIRCAGTLRPQDLAAIETAVRAWLGL
jgi:mRNA interferase MazF